MADSSYYGFRVLTPISEVIGVPVDQVNFIACQLSALLLGYLFRVHLGPHTASPLTRHSVEVIVGSAMMIFVYGHQALYVVGQTLSCLLLIRILPHRYMALIVTVFAMLQLGICHIWRQTLHYRSTTAVNISAPLMINTQRVTSLAWSIFDGRKKDTSKFSPMQKRLAVEKIPSLLEVLSYSLNFHSVMVGPFAFYKDYENFINGENLKNHNISNGASNNNNISPKLALSPSPLVRVVKNLLMFGISTVIVVLVNPHFSEKYLSDPELQNSGYFNILLYTVILTGTFRFKYYLAWKLGEAVNNNAGLGFHYDDKGEAQWDLIENANLWEIEFALNIKGLVDHWNITTTHWLRYLVYERVTSMRMVSVFCLTTVWHGFYPGYYLCAATCAIFVMAARLIRRHFRGWFITSKEKHVVYDVITMVTTRVAIGYMCFPFIQLEYGVSMEIFKRLYFSFHIVALLIIAVLAGRRRPVPAEKKSS